MREVTASSGRAVFGITHEHDPPESVACSSSRSPRHPSPARARPLLRASPQLFGHLTDLGGRELVERVHRHRFVVGCAGVHERMASTSPRIVQDDRPAARVGHVGTGRPQVSRRTERGSHRAGWPTARRSVGVTVSASSAVRGLGALDDRDPAPRLRRAVVDVERRQVGRGRPGERDDGGGRLVAALNGARPHMLDLRRACGRDGPCQSQILTPHPLPNPPPATRNGTTLRRFCCPRMRPNARGRSPAGTLGRRVDVNCEQRHRPEGVGVDRRRSIVTRPRVPGRREG